ncbi:MAG TPA: adenylate/guanylate cyclase domain-containing protein [Gaiellaceae bacterium]|jgi:class 3 adenylate cyclase/tetratricopeptide (TPR) repeat protein
MTSAELTGSTISCPSCGELNPPGSRFCNRCGAQLGDQPALREERKLVSILFVDLVGFTARSDRADPEDVRDALQLYHADAKQRIEQYGGVLEKFIGDAVMAVFGAPISHGDDAERAVRAGLRVLEGLEELNQQHGLDLAARAAVNTGEAVVAVDAARDGSALATGDVVNTASRLQSAAPPGRLIVGSETYRATRHAVLYESFESVAAKGKADALSGWLAVEAAAEPMQRPVAAEALFGRTREVDLMLSLWQHALVEHRPHLVTLLGPPGIGKSRLCREISARVTDDGGRILRGRCLPYEEQAGYQAFSRLVHEACGILESDPPAVAREKLQRTVSELMPQSEASEALRHLALLLGLAPDDAVPQVLLLYFAARRFIECVGVVQPTVFVFEDIHWAQSSEIALLEYLAQHVRDSPVMIVAAARPELLDTRPTWGSGLVAQTTILLDPLPPAEAGALAAQLLQSGERSFDLDRLVEVAGGNPLFLEELAASVLELGESGELPVTVREAIAARIDAMPPNARSAVLAAAIIGKTFWRGVLDAVAGIDDIDDALGILEARDLIRRDPASQLGGDAQFTFKHMLIREVAYATVPRARRREGHAAVARHVEETLGEATETLSAILAYHWREAGEPARAIPYLLAAADSARRGWAKGAVVDLYSRALELAEDDGLRRRIRFQRGLALVELADYPRADEELGLLVPELQGQARLDALIARGHATLWTERDAETLAIAEQALPLARELGDETAVAAAFAMESQALAMRGGAGDLDRALELGDEALERWVPGTRALDLRHHLHLHADATYWTGQYERSVELSRRTRALAHDVHSPESLLRGGGLEALALAGLGRHEEAIAIWDDLFELARELGQSPQVVLNYSTLVYRELYDLDEARSRSEEALELSASETFGMPRQFAGSDLLFTQLLAGDIGGAQSVWPKLWDAAANATAWTTWLVAGRLLAARAEIALQAESAEAAAEWAERAIEVARRTRRRKYEGQALATFGQALARLDRSAEALAALRRSVAIADELVGPPARWGARAALGNVAYAFGDDAAASEAYTTAADLIRGFGTSLAPERKEHLLGAPQVTEILSLAGGTTSA